jgi:beta-lactamase class D
MTVSPQAWSRWKLVPVDLAVLGLAYWIYLLVRNDAPDAKAAALRRGRDLLSAERAVHLDPERSLNSALAAHPVLANIADYYYATFHFVIVLMVFAWLYWRHPTAARRSLLAWYAMNPLALLSFWLLPTAPPRLLPSAGFVDTVVHFHTWGSLADSTVASAANQYAAFPSLHLGWALWAAIVVHRFAKRRWIGLMAFIYPVFTCLVVLGTANHYVIDVVGGVAVCLLGFVVAHPLPATARWLRRTARVSGERVVVGHRRPVILLALLVAACVVAAVSVGTAVDRQRVVSARRRARAVAEKYLAAWSEGRYPQMAQLAGQPSAVFSTYYRSAAKSLRETSARYALTSLVLGTHPHAAFRAQVVISGYGTWNYDGELALADVRNSWSVRWSPASLVPQLQTGDRLGLVRSPEPPLEGHVLDDIGQRIRPLDTELATSILGPPTGAVGAPSLRAVLAPQLNGRAATGITIVSAAGVPLDVLHRFPAVSGRSVKTTLDIGMQHFAEGIIGASSLPTSLVAVDTRTGAVLAAADNSAAANGTALAGRFPPGSTFKIVTATAALENGYRLDTLVDCPADRTAGGFTFHNAGGEVLGRITFEQAFAVSCNTAFVNIAESLPAGALQRAAAFYGCTTMSPSAVRARPLPVTSFGCNYPMPQNAAGYAASAFGQAQVEVSPLGMALICGTAASGTWHAPRLIASAQSATATRTLPPEVAAELHQAMRAVVTSGTATSIADTAVAGKTGTAEYGTGNPLPTEAWFTGYLGHYAVAVLVQDGGYGGDAAAPLAAKFLTGIQPAPAARAGAPA